MAAMKAASAAGVNRLSEPRRLIVACPVAQAGASVAPHTLYEYPVLAGAIRKQPSGVRRASWRASRRYRGSPPREAWARGPAGGVRGVAAAPVRWCGKACRFVG